MRHFNWFFFITLLLVLCIGRCKAQVKNDQQIAQFERDRSTFQLFEEKHRNKIKTRHLELTYLHWGKKNNKTFIWLPGSFLSAYDFEPFAKALVDAGYYVLSIDHYGHGLTQIPNVDLSFADFADDLYDLMNELGLESAVIGGFSRGAYMATAFYERHPTKVQKLVLEEGGTVPFKALFDNFTSQELDQFLNTVEPPKEVKEKLFSVFETKLLAYQALTEINNDESNYQYFGIIKPKNDKWIIYHGLAEYMHMDNGEHYRELLYSPELTSKYARSIVQLDPTYILKNLKIPLLIIEANGEPDLFISEDGNQALKLKHKDLITYSRFNCDNHNIHYSCPESFLQCLLLFLNAN